MLSVSRITLLATLGVGGVIYGNHEPFISDKQQEIVTNPVLYDQFLALDLNRDRALRRGELQIYPSIHRGFDALDANSDGRLSWAEFAAVERNGAQIAELSSY